MSDFLIAKLIHVGVLLLALHFMAHFIQSLTGVKTEKWLIKAEKKLLKLAWKGIRAILAIPFKLLGPRAKKAAKATNKRLGL